MAETPCRVRRVVVRGTHHTHNSVVQQEFRDALRARTLGDIGLSCSQAMRHLHSLGIFESADIVCDRSAYDTYDGQPLADIIVTVVEKKRLSHASTGVHTSSGEGSMDANVTVRNLLGRGERYDLRMEVGHQRSNAFKLHLAKPRWLGRDVVLEAEVGKQTISHQKHSSFDEKLRGGKVGCTIGHPSSPGGAHELSYELGLREVCKLPIRTASWSVLQQRGLSVKSALQHTYTLSTLDDALTPTRGSLLRLYTELAGVPLLGDAFHHKHQLELQTHAPLLPEGKLTLSVSARCGLLLPLSSVPQPTTILDRFFLGGPNSFWGFRTHGVGPRETRHTSDGIITAKTPRDALGGDVLGVATVALSSKLPGQLAKLGVSGQIFASAGSLQSLSELSGGDVLVVARRIPSGLLFSVFAAAVIPTWACLLLVRPPALLAPTWLVRRARRRCEYRRRQHDIGDGVGLRRQLPHLCGRGLSVPDILGAHRD